MSDNLYTIGHSNHSIDTFIALLKQHKITAVADVRSGPYSRYTPHFCQKPLRAALKKEGIQYVFLGEELGARTSDRSCYVDGKALYERIAATDAFKTGIQSATQPPSNEAAQLGLFNLSTYTASPSTTAVLEPRAKEDTLQEAYRLQGLRIAYFEKSDGSNN